MKKYIYLLICWGMIASPLLADSIRKEVLANGVIRLTVGTPEAFTPYTFCPEQPKTEALDELSEGDLPFLLEEVGLVVTPRGCQVSVPLQGDEQLYGFGLQIGSFQQQGLKKKPIVNDHPVNNLGPTHAPQPFYVSTKGYGILVNTLRYPTFYCGTNKRKVRQTEKAVADGQVATSTDDLYRNEKAGNYVYVDIPNCEGIEVFIFKGTSLRDVVQRYNLFSGGGCLPPMWGMGFKYRTKTDCTQAGVLKMQSYFRRKEIPCDVIGLEPGWHTAAYSCSYVWNKERFPDHQTMLSEMTGNHYKVNLWEHAYVHPTSPLYEPMLDYSGDFLVWKGLVPDFVQPEARKRFADHHRTLMAAGISGFKLDECDNSDIVVGSANWGFPEMSRFPSGIDGEQMHQAFGVLYLRTLNEMYKQENRRTYQDYRASGLFASSIPASLYSDIYGHKDYVQMMCNSAFGGLIWSPEVRQSGSKSEFFRRLQTVLLSGHAVVDSWFLQNPPWLQYDKDKNNAGIFLPDSIEMENITRKLINVRMQLVPYLYSAFARYNQQGVPPFRPLVMDFPGDKNTLSLDDQYMMGEDLMVTPLLRDSLKRNIYFPAGEWYNFNTNEKYAGGRSYEVSFRFDEMPLFVRGGSILPLAKPVQYITGKTTFELVCRVYGAGNRPSSLYEDDGETYDFEQQAYSWTTLRIEKGKGKSERKGNYKPKRYILKDWTFIQ